MERIFLAEDDEAIFSELSALLTANGYRVVDAPPCDLALLDVNLADKNGFDLCRRLRKTSSVPVIFLTARESAQDELIGFGVGGDDYIRKPYDSSVLLARIARLLKHKEKSVLAAKGITLDCESMTVTYAGNSAVLTRNEMRILACLMKKQVCRKEEIIEYLWDNSLYIDENTLYVNINRLREKLKRLGAEGYVVNVRSVGYSL